MTIWHRGTQSCRDAEHFDKDPLWQNNARPMGTNASGHCLRESEQVWPPATTSRTNLLLFRQLVSV